jgi:gamma-glutamyl:cysteine ligase YbdK (ATP-grasp superfamily)
MGQACSTASFNSNDFTHFSQRVQRQLSQLKQRLYTPAPFSPNDYSFGAELELYLVDKHFAPQCVNVALMDMLGDKRLTEEINQFNLEINSSPVAARNSPFSAMHKEFNQILDSVITASEHFSALPLWIGILPTLQAEHLSLDYMTDKPRYHALTDQLRKRSQGPFKITINNQEHLNLVSEDVTLEGANTSFQVHFKVPEKDFVALYNAAQLITPLMVATAANSPLIMERQLWEESRIALFKQSIDHRNKQKMQWRQPARVSFGQGWLRHNPWELFAENVALHEPILPYISDTEKPYAELMMHHGTVWAWNRAVFDTHDNGHLRIEFRALPAGPSITDMLANAALTIGLTQAISHNIEDYLVRLPFQHAEYNFYRAAKHGLDAQILWPSKTQNTLCEQPVLALLEECLPLAEAGLHELGVPKQEITYYLGVIAKRVAAKRNGANWQRQMLAKYETQDNRHIATIKMLNEYQLNMRADRPIHEW